MQLTTDRLYLREFVAGDWPSVLAYQQEPHYLRYYLLSSRSEADAQDFVQRFVDQSHSSSDAPFSWSPPCGKMSGSSAIADYDAKQRTIGRQTSATSWRLTTWAKGMPLRLPRQCRKRRFSAGRRAGLGMRQEGRLRERTSTLTALVGHAPLWHAEGRLDQPGSAGG